MTLENFRKIDITWDKATRRIYENLRVASSDATGRKLVVQVLDDGRVVNSSGVSLNLYWETRDQKNNGLDSFNLVDASKGLYEIYFTTGMLSNIGKLNANLQLVDSKGTVTSETFTIEVFKGISNEAVESDDSFTSLTKALVQVNNLEKNYAPRLNEVTSQLAQTATKAYVDKKAREVASGTPKITANSISELESSYPNGSEENALVTSNGHIYHWNGNSWVDTGILYQAVGIPDDSITVDKISSENQTENILDKDALMTGQYYGSSPVKVGEPIRIISGGNWNGVNAVIPVSPGDVVRFNRAFMNGYFIGVDDEDKLRQFGTIVDPAGYAEITVQEGITGFYTTVFKDYVEDAMITINNPMPSDYVPHELTKTLDWLRYKPNSIKLEALDNEVVEKITERVWNGKTFVTLGDSITWQDGKEYSDGQIARGYQTHLIKKLGFSSFDNYGISGRPIANGTANGVGTNTTGKEISDYSIYDLVIIAGGTNDFRLNVPLGELGGIGDTNFDDTTFYGAYRDLVEYILKNVPIIRIVLFTPLQRDNGGYDVNTVNTAGHKLNDYVNAIKEIGEMYGLPVCDMYSNSGSTKLTLDTFTRDGLHPNDVGYKRMGSYASRFIESVGS